MADNDNRNKQNHESTSGSLGHLYAVVQKSNFRANGIDCKKCVWFYPCGQNDLLLPSGVYRVDTRQEEACLTLQFSIQVLAKKYHSMN